jgi:hypothetical protein
MVLEVLPDVVGVTRLDDVPHDVALGDSGGQPTANAWLLRTHLFRFNLNQNILNASKKKRFKPILKLN